MDLPDRFNDRPLPDEVDPQLLEQALTHSSYAHEEGLSYDNERLEFLGDATIELIAASHLYDEYPEQPEGTLSKTKSGIVSTGSLSRIARRFELDRYLRVSRGQKQIQRGEAKLLADSFEAFVGAIFLSTGYERTREFVLPELKRELRRFEEGALHNPKGVLLEIAQEHGWPEPDYEVVEVKPPEHDPYHIIAVRIHGTKLGEGEGRKKKSAEQQAARQAIQRLNDDPPGWAEEARIER